jgi:hypothetical protein
VTPLLINCEVLTEGFDEPAVDAILMARPTQSTGLYTQVGGPGGEGGGGRGGCTHRKGGRWGVGGGGGGGAGAVNTGEGGGWGGELGEQMGGGGGCTNRWAQGGRRDEAAFPKAMHTGGHRGGGG